MQIDPRGTRFAGALTTLILCAVLITGSSALLAVQTAIFALGAFTSLQYSPYGWLYRIAIQPRLAPPRRAGGRPSAPLRPERRLRLRPGRHRRLPRRRRLARPGRNRVRPCCGLSQRSLRLLPRLRDVPVRSPFPKHLSTAVRRSVEHRLVRAPQPAAREIVVTWVGCADDVPVPTASLRRLPDRHEVSREFVHRIIATVPWAGQLSRRLSRRRSGSGSSDCGCRRVHWFWRSTSQKQVDMGWEDTDQRDARR